MAATRVCHECQKDKSVNGVWYLLAVAGPTLFICGSCYGPEPELPVPAPI